MQEVGQAECVSRDSLVVGVPTRQVERKPSSTGVRGKEVRLSNRIKTVQNRMFCKVRAKMRSEFGVGRKEGVRICHDEGKMTRR